jgi:hypothetical protein
MADQSDAAKIQANSARFNLIQVNSGIRILSGRSGMKTDQKVKNLFENEAWSCFWGCPSPWRFDEIAPSCPSMLLRRRGEVKLTQVVDFHDNFS